MTPTRVWITEAVNTANPTRGTDQYSIVMRFNKKEWDASAVKNPVDIQYAVFPSQNNSEPEVHIDIGLISEQGILMLEQAIHKLRYNVNKEPT